MLYENGQFFYIFGHCNSDRSIIFEPFFEIFSVLDYLISSVYDAYRKKISL